MWAQVTSLYPVPYVSIVVGTYNPVPGVPNRIDKASFTNQERLYEIV